MPGTEIVKFIELKGVPHDAETLVSLLEAAGGSLKRFLSEYPDDQHEYLLSFAEQFVTEHADKRLKQRWNAAIRRNAIARMRLLQNRSLERLESLAKDENGMLSWSSMAKEAAAHKLILAGLLAGETHAAKQRDEHVIGSGDDADAADAAEAAAAMEV